MRRRSVDAIRFFQNNFIAAYTIIPPKRLDIFPPDWGMLRKGLDAFIVFFKQLPRVRLYVLSTDKSVKFDTKRAYLECP